MTFFWGRAGLPTEPFLSLFVPLSGQAFQDVLAEFTGHAHVIRVPGAGDGDADVKADDRVLRAQVRFFFFDSTDCGLCRDARKRSLEP